MTKQIDFDAWSETADEDWRRIIAPQLQESHSFEIHCWQDELDALELALRYGDIKPSEWQGGLVIVGEVTPAFCDFLLSLPRPADREVYPKMTPFFNLFLDNGFCSEHYGTELFQRADD